MAVIAVKVHGAWNLHHALLENDLDFFVSMASSTGLIGNHGQSAYCATTTFLDAFSSYRASMGLPAHTINLGVVVGVGYFVERPELGLQGKKTLGQEINETKLLAVLDGAMSGQMGKESHYHSIVGLEYTGDDAQNFWSRRPIFSHLRAKKGPRRNDHDGSAETTESVSKRLHEAPSAAAAKKLIYDSLATKFSTVLMIAEEDLGAEKPMGAYGVDSLVGVELRNWISREMGASVMLVDLLADNTLAGLTELVFRRSKLCEKLHSQDGEGINEGGMKPRGG
jgi:aryl carrier-like protein